MNSMPKPEPREANNVFVTSADDQLAAYRQMSVDEQIAHVAEQLSKLEREAAPHPPPARGRKGSRRAPALRGLTGLLVASCIFAAAFGQSSYGESARLTIAQWAPQLRPTPFMGKPEPDAQWNSTAVQLAQAELQDLAPTTATETARQVTNRITPDLVRLFQAMARDLVTVEQRIEQLRTRQNQIADDNAKAVEKLTTNQEQMARLIAKASEENLRP
jgi:hypothetical protein